MGYTGGKAQAGVWQRIISLLPPHKQFVELFAGSAAITRLKKPAEKTALVEKSARQAAALRKRFPPGGAEHVIEADAFAFLNVGDWTPQTLVYADPPYVLSTRGGREYYDHELSDADHVRLLHALAALPSKVVLSGYPSKLYARAGFGVPPTRPGWHVITFTVRTRSHREVTECLWLNFPPPVVLHDYRQIGDGWRERQRIKRKVARWVARLQRHDAQERAALFSALVDVMGADALRAAVDSVATAPHVGNGAPAPHAANGVEIRDAAPV